ncbi:MAG: hypothetical protein WB987_16785 [Candidatus Acidiferrales bacterium]
MEMTISRAVILVMMLAQGSGVGLALSSDDTRAREAARTAVQTKRGGGDTFLVVHRRDDLEDRLCSVADAERDATANRPCAFVFVLSDEGYEFKSGRVSYHLSVHGALSYYVIVSRDLAKIFRVWGFSDSPKQFNEMARATRITLPDELSALRFEQLYADIDPENLKLQPLVSKLQAKQLAESGRSAYHGQIIKTQAIFRS